MRRLLGFLMTVVGALMVVLTTITLLRPVWFQELYIRGHDLLADTPLRMIADSGAGRETRAPESVPEPGKPIGVLEIPRLGLSTVVIEGDETAALLLGVGHLSDTPMPWKAGNSVLAAHRDTFFRPLARIRRDDVIRFSTDDAELEYVVRGTKVVSPTDVDVLAPTSSNTLTLITCYPFYYIGPAPKRFIVTAERVS